MTDLLALAEAVWEALKRECCADPVKALRCVMVSEAQFRRAYRAALRARAAGHGEG